MEDGGFVVPTHAFGKDGAPGIFQDAGKPTLAGKTGTREGGAPGFPSPTFQKRDVEYLDLLPIWGRDGGNFFLAIRNGGAFRGSVLRL